MYTFMPPTRSNDQGYIVFVLFVVSFIFGVHIYTTNDALDFDIYAEIDFLDFVVVQGIVFHKHI